jgi:hypothetical protein
MNTETYQRRSRSRLERFGLALLAVVGMMLMAFPGTADEHQKYVQYDGFDGPGNGKHVVLIAGDEEYRSEETLPQFGKILAKRHGFKCTVLFPINPKTGNIKPNYNKNVPGTKKLNNADLMVIFTRFRQLPDEQMKPIDNFLKAGKPVIGLRTATHGFKFSGDSKWHHYTNGYGGPKDAWSGGFGKLVLGEQWITHRGEHSKEATRGIIPDKAMDHELTNGINNGDIWGPTDVYGLDLPLPGDSKVVVRGQVLKGMHRGSAPHPKKNDPMHPIAWTKSYQLPDGKKGQSFTTTMGASEDFINPALRRLLVNSVYYLLDMEVPDVANVQLVGEYKPTDYGFGNFKKGLKPSDYKLEK